MVLCIFTILVILYGMTGFYYVITFFSLYWK